MNLNDDHIRTALYESLGLMSEDSLMNEDNELNTNSVGSHNGGEDTHIYGQDEETSACSGESVEMYSDEQILAGPMRGMFFKSVESVFHFYKRNAKMRGFCVLKRTLYSCYTLFVCDKSRKPTNQKHTKRIVYEARVNVIRKRDGSWMVTKVCRNHIHQLDSIMSRQMTGHISISKSVKRILEANDRADLRPCKSVRLLEVQSDGPENMSCTPKDCRNYIKQQRRLQMLEGDANTLCQFFSDMHMKDNEFYYSVGMDGASRIKSVVWVHSRCKYAYEEFNDVTQNGVTLSGNSRNDHIPKSRPNHVPNEGNDHIPNPTPNPVPNGPSPNFVDPEVHRSHGRSKEIRYKPQIEVLYSSFRGMGVRYNSSRGRDRAVGGRVTSQNGERGGGRGTSQDGGRGRRGAK
ncbi:hypothetical protein K7X08_011721 [Anisodus acutangulus]|uniref:Protein FAR1-RELATED SEQUENCE n=1 Tax=Anisodus acutangulus TaxID=402998 RepID=A0A9Q1RLN7_9SOLA|nr:hypothetical protein K7X08_011721 [Anisodus acutangulus]